MKKLLMIVLAGVLSACAGPKTDAEYKAAGYCLRDRNWYPNATVLNLGAEKKIVCNDTFWEPLGY